MSGAFMRGNCFKEGVNMRIEVGVIMRGQVLQLTDLSTARSTSIPIRNRRVGSHEQKPPFHSFHFG